MPLLRTCVSLEGAYVIFLIVDPGWETMATIARKKSSLVAPTRFALQQRRLSQPRKFRLVYDSGSHTFMSRGPLLSLKLANT